MDGLHEFFFFFHLTLRVCLVRVKTGGMENRVKNAVFHCLIEGKKKERQKIGEKVFPPEPTFFILPNWEENEKGKVMSNAFYTNTLTLLHSLTPLTFPLLYNKDIIVNLYKLHFPSSHFSLQLNKKVFHPPTFPHKEDGK